MTKEALLLSMIAGLALGTGCEASQDAASSSDADADSDGDGDTDTDGDGDGDSDGDTDTGWDTSAEESCDLDLLFVIDNSVSMGDFQEALGLAFAGFTDALIETLNDDTNVHVGVTSTEMGYSSMGMTSGGTSGCTFEGQDGHDEVWFYENFTPDIIDTEVNGAQGRLYQPDGHPPFFAMDIGAPPDEVLELKSWFQAAAAVGTGGSNIEMLTAPVGWVGDPSNAATNEGFLRDEDTVLVVFFMQDEPDQTPLVIDSTDGGQWVLDRLVALKEECGGLECIVAGGFTDPDECGTEPRPIRSFLDGLTRPYAVQGLPFTAGDPTAMAAEMLELLSTTLLETIDDTCAEIVDIE